MRYFLGLIFLWSSFSHAGFGRFDLDFLWPNGVVPYEVDGSCPVEAGTIRSALEGLSHQTRGIISFIPMSEYHLDGIRFKGMPQDAKRKTLGSIPFQQVGRAPGVNVIYLNAGAGIPVIQHEILHKLGLEHEHQRPDRDEHVQVSNTENTGNPFNFAIQRSPRYFIYTPYDLSSIMQYGTQQTDGKILSRLGNDIPNPERLSEGDIATLKKMYERARTKHGKYLFKIEGRYEESFEESKPGLLGLGGFGTKKRSIIDDKGITHSLADDLTELKLHTEQDRGATVEILTNMASGEESSGYLHVRADRFRIHFSNGSKMEYIQKRILAEDGEMMERVK